MWFFIAILGYFLLAIVFILDKLIVQKSVSKPVVYTFYSTIIMFGALIAWPFIGFDLLAGMDWLWAIVSGVAFGFALWTFYISVHHGEVTHIGPFNGAMVTIFLYVLGWQFLGEKLSGLQIGGIVILIFASLLLSFEKSRKHSGFHVGFLWAIVSGLLFAISHVSAKYLYGIYPFWTALIWTRATTGFVGLLILLSPTVRAALARRSPHRADGGGAKTKPKTYARRHAGWIIAADKVFSVLSNVLIQYAMAIGIVTLVGAISGLQFVLMFVMVLLLTKLLPRVFKEYFTKKELVVELIALVLVVIGLVFMV
ncbi:MAG: DMT family transporter [Candidatus Magasanikbacteria bacterium]|nr:DMT family transporter [Candidatus Magasanikbacteria bacterium]MBI5222566.1 DMT family transporter [Candidatus Magasanikbacteria bacterium]